MTGSDGPSLREVLTQIHSSLDLTRSLDTVARGVASGTGFKVAAVTMVLPNGDYQVVAVEGDEKARAQLLGSVEPAEVWERLYRAATPLGRLLWVDHTADVIDDDMTVWVPDIEESADPEAWHPMDTLFAPLVDSHGRRVGALSVDVPIDGRRPRADQLAQLELFAIQAALAIEHAHSHAAARQNAVLRERERMAEDMHDLVTQRLYAVSLELDIARRDESRQSVDRRIERALEGIDEAVTQLRASIRGSTRAVGADDLEATIRHIADRAAPGFDTAPSVRWAGDTTAVTPDIARDLFAVLTEALSNAAKHARARSVGVALIVGDSSVTLTVRDDGVGIGDGKGRGSSGLDTMRRRAGRHGGTCTYAANMPTGTVVTWSVPRP